jgi:hypothetical protein
MAKVLQFGGGLVNLKDDSTAPNKYSKQDILDGILCAHNDDTVDPCQVTRAIRSPCLAWLAGSRSDLGRRLCEEELPECVH